MITPSKYHFSPTRDGEDPFLKGAVIDGVLYGDTTRVITPVSNFVSNRPARFELAPNYPNPFNNATVISYSISKDADVKLIIYDILGREAKALVNERKRSGSYNILFTAEGLASGTYFAVLRTNSNTLIHKILFIK